MTELTLICIVIGSPTQNSLSLGVNSKSSTFKKKSAILFNCTPCLKIVNKLAVFYYHAITNYCMMHLLFDTFIIYISILTGNPFFIIIFSFQNPLIKNPGTPYFMRLSARFIRTTHSTLLRAAKSH